MPYGKTTGKSDSVVDDFAKVSWQAILVAPIFGRGQQAGNVLYCRLWLHYRILQAGLAGSSCNGARHVRWFKIRFLKPFYGSSPTFSPQHFRCLTLSANLPIHVPGPPSHQHPSWHYAGRQGRFSGSVSLAWNPSPRNRKARCSWPPTPIQFSLGCPSFPYQKGQWQIPIPLRFSWPQRRYSQRSNTCSHHRRYPPACRPWSRLRQIRPHGCLPPNIDARARYRDDCNQHSMGFVWVGCEAARCMQFACYATTLPERSFT